MYHGICLILGGVKYANKNMCKIWKKDQDSGGSATQSKPVIFPKNTCTLWTCRCEVKSQKALWKSIDDIPWVWPPHVTVTTKIITFLAGDPYKPSFTTVIVRGPHPRYTRLLFNNQNCTKMTWHIWKSYIYKVHLWMSVHTECIQKGLTLMLEVKMLPLKISPLTCRDVEICRNEHQEIAIYKCWICIAIFGVFLAPLVNLNNVR